MSDIDVLLIGRPDHSLQIYDALLRDGRLRFHYLGFKIFPNWLKSVLSNKHMVFMAQNYSVGILLTIINILKYNSGLRMFQRLSELGKLSAKTKKLLRKTQPKIIHYWPKYCSDAIAEYLGRHPEVQAFADIHMPNPSVILKEMAPIYEKYGIPVSNVYLAAESALQSNYLKNVSKAMAPSQYVVDTYKQEFPDIEFHVVPYGVKKWCRYQLKEHISENHNKFRFVYAGRVSLEKGCDILFDVFSQLPQYELHIYGSENSSQKIIFEKYKANPNIIFHGLVPKIELQNELAKYDVGIHLSRFDAYSLSVAEMQGVGLPVLVSDRTGNKDLIVEQDLGEVASLEITDIINKIQRITTPIRYNELLDNLNGYLNKENIEFEDLILDFYNKQISMLS